MLTISDLWVEKMDQEVYESFIPLPKESQRVTKMDDFQSKLNFVESVF